MVPDESELGRNGIGLGNCLGAVVVEPVVALVAVVVEQVSALDAL